MTTLTKNEQMIAKMNLIWNLHLKTIDHIPQGPTSLNINASDNCAQCEEIRSMVDDIRALESITDDLYYKREEWLKENGAEAKDILSDEKGDFIYDVMDLGDTDHMDYRKVKIYLPKHLNSSKIFN